MIRTMTRKCSSCGNAIYVKYEGSFDSPISRGRVVEIIGAMAPWINNGSYGTKPSRKMICCEHKINKMGGSRSCWTGMLLRSKEWKEVTL